MDCITSLLCSPISWIVSAGTALYFLYSYGTSTFNYFAEQGVPGPKPLPFVGNVWGLWKENFPKHDKALMKKYGRYVGYFEGAVPNLWTTDTDIIKSVFVKDFDHFINRRDLVVKMKVIRKMVSLIQNQEWKDVRSSITPAFTTGKIKMMSTMIKECADRLVNTFSEIAETQGKLDAKKHFNIFTMDVIARCAFGITIENLGDENDPFLKNANAIFRAPVNKTPVILLPFLLPKFMARFGDVMFSSEPFKFFFKVLEDVVKQRANSDQKYHDFVEIAAEAINEYKKEVDGKEVPMWDKEEVDEIVIAQSVVFLLAGFDTTSTTLSNTLFMLARNPEVQEKLYQEVTRRCEQYDDVSHEMIVDFSYLDHVINEVLRMCPTAPRVERCCNKDVTYKGIHIKKGTMITVPSFALHYDEEYYSEPNKFNPDRWSADNETKPDPYAFLPFGLGPRNCVGMRFALEEMKIVLCALVKNFRFFPVAETPEHVEYEDGFVIVAQPVHSMIGMERR